MKSKLITYATLATIATFPAYSAITFNLTYIATPADNDFDVGASQGGINGSGITADLVPIFDRAIATFERHLTGYRQDVTGPMEINLTASAPMMDGPRGLLAFALPTSSVVRNGFTLTTDGAFYMDIDDLAGADPDFAYETVFHEISHALGIGSHWESNGLYVNNSGEYTGAKGLEKYRRDFDPNATFVPVELDGGGGTANGHWDEGSGARVNNPDAPYNGRLLDDETLSGTAAGAGQFLSDLTLGSFYDMGYTIDYIIPDYDYYWDAGNPTGDGNITAANGQWTQGTTNFTNENGETNRAYEDTHNMFFTDTASTVTLDGTFRPDRLIFQTNGYTLTQGILNTDNDMLLRIASAQNTVNLNTTVSGTGLFTIEGDGTVNNTGKIASDTNVTSGLLLNNGSGIISGDITIGENASLQTDANGFSADANLINNGNTTISADQTLAGYTSTGGNINGAGELTANTYNLNDGASVDVDLGTGVLNTNGNVNINSNTQTSVANIISGITITTGNLGGNLNIARPAELRSGADSLDDAAVVNNSGTLTLSGNEQIGSYIGSSTGLLAGTGKLITNSFSGGAINVAALDRNSLNLSIETLDNDITLGAGTTLRFDTNSVNLVPFDSFELFENNAGAIAGNVGFENLELIGLGNNGSAVFEVSTGKIHIISDGASFGDTPNTSATAGGIFGIVSGTQFSNVESLATGSQAIVDRINLLANADPNDNITQKSQLEELSPEVYGSLADYALRQHLSYKDAATHAQYTVRNGSWEIFAGVNTQEITSDSSVDNADYELKGTGGYLGLSKQYSNVFRFGLFAGIDDGEIKSENGLLDLDASGEVFGIFTELGYLMPWENERKHGLITAGVSYGQFDYDGTRTAQQLLNSTGDISASTLEFGLGYKVALIDNNYFKLSPYVGIDYIVADVDGFSETGSLNNLRVNDYKKKLFLLNYGLEAQWAPTAGAFGFTAKIGMQNNMGDDDTDISANFEGASAFTVNSPGLSDTILEARGGVFLNLSENAQIRATYFQLSGDDIDSASGGNIGLSYTW